MWSFIISRDTLFHFLYSRPTVKSSTLNLNLSIQSFLFKNVCLICIMSLLLALIIKWHRATDVRFQRAEFLLNRCSVEGVRSSWISSFSQLYGGFAAHCKAVRSHYSAGFGFLLLLPKFLAKESCCLLWPSSKAAAVFCLLSPWLETNFWTLWIL